MTRLLTVLGVLVLLGGAVGCSPMTQPAEVQPHTEQKGPVGPVPPGLEKFYGQSLSWGPCEQYATNDSDRTAYRDPGLECARLQVPMDYSDPQGQTITVGVLRKPAG